MSFDDPAVTIQKLCIVYWNFWPKLLDAETIKEEECSRSRNKVPMQPSTFMTRLAAFWRV